MRDFFAFIAIVSGVFIMLFAPAIGLAYFVGRASCYKAYSEFQPSYGFWEGCRIMVDGVATPVDIVREIR